MSVTVTQVATLRRLARVYRRILVLALPAAAVAGCQGADDPFAPAGAAEPAGMEAVETSALGSLTTGGNRIVFSSLTADGSDVWTAAPDGTTARRISDYAGIENYPTWSWDHKQIAFVHMRNGHQDIMVMNADGTHKHWARPTDSPALMLDTPSWAPDGSHLLARTDIQGQLLLAKVDLATGAVTLVAPSGMLGIAGTYPVYDKSGTRIYFVDYSYKGIKSFVPGGPLTTVLAPTIYVGDLAPSPDGTRLAYYAYVDKNNEIYTINLTTKVTKRLTNNSAQDYTPRWSPDGTKLAFASDRVGAKLQIWTMNSSTGGNVTQITDRPRGAYMPDWAH